MTRLIVDIVKPSIPGLEHLTVVELQKRAEVAGLDAEKIHVAEHAVDSKVALIRLLLFAKNPQLDIALEKKLDRARNAAATKIQALARTRMAKRGVAEMQRDIKAAAEAKVKAEIRETLAQLKSKLEGLKVKELKQRGEVWGCTVDELARSEARDNPRLEIRRLVLEKARAWLNVLQGLSLQHLKKRAEAAGSTAKELDEAENSEEPRLSFLRLLCAQISKDQIAYALVNLEELGTPELIGLMIQYKSELDHVKLKQMVRLAFACKLSPEDVQMALDSTDPKLSIKRILLDLAKEALDELQNGTLPDLKDVAQRSGLSALQIEDCEDDDDPKLSLIKLLFARMPFRLGNLSEKTVPQDYSDQDEEHVGAEYGEDEEDVEEEARDLFEEDESSQSQAHQVELVGRTRERHWPPLLEKTFARLEGEIERLKVTELKRRASTYGCTDEEIEVAMDEDIPKLALQQLILDTAETAMDALLKTKLSELKRKAGTVGVSQEELDNADDEDDPKAVIIKLIFTKKHEIEEQARFVAVPSATHVRESETLGESGPQAEPLAEQARSETVPSATHVIESETLGESGPQAEPLAESIQNFRGRATVRGSDREADLSESPGPHRMGPGAFGLVWWYLNDDDQDEDMQRPSAKLEDRTEDASLPLLSSSPDQARLQRFSPTRSLAMKDVQAEVSLEDVLQTPPHLWPWIAVHAPLKPGQRRKIAARAVLLEADQQDSDEAEVVGQTSVPSLSQALHLVHWCWAHTHSIIAASSLVPLLFSCYSSNDDDLPVQWALLLLATHLWRRATLSEPRQFLVDNSLLKAPTTGLSYCFSRSLDDVDHGKAAPWGQVVLGKKRGKWVKVAHCCYLPVVLDGVQVLRDDFSQLEVLDQPQLSPRQAKLKDRAPGQLPAPREKADRRLSDASLLSELSALGEHQVEDISELAKDLKKALGRAVEQRRQLDEAVAGHEEAMLSRRQSRVGELQGVQLELEAANERRALEAGIMAGSAASAAAAAAAAARAGNPVPELSSAKAARDAARHRARWLEEELKAAKAPGGAIPAVATGPLRALQREVAELRSELHTFESEELEGVGGGQSGSSRLQARTDPAEFDSPELETARQELAQSAAELAARSAALKRGEAALAQKRVKVRIEAEEASLNELESSARKAECASLLDQQQELQGDERAASARARQLEREARDLAQAYERSKQLCFTYGAAILRTPGSRGILGQRPGATSKASKTRGLDALIEVLAQRYGWAEVAFLRLDRRGAGRLGPVELRMGLLLGARIDFPAVTGLTAEALLAAMDRRGVGFITASDLAACRPDLWHQLGAEPPRVGEKFRALPWSAVGGASEAFKQATQSSSGAPVLDWPRFEGIVCKDLRALPKAEAQEIFAASGEKDFRFDNLVVTKRGWEAATQEIPNLQRPYAS
eukprot:TRINITY_DN7676_c0_g1_i12.p1 TRINITY_DN7676_c0_g1~~TRINITY_DN7676_c0_g1_i12.p1  ORF type:complete len:1419 (+),score=370.51 TRINITY_DN7676_c0_g1_i12:1474-5730(+)